MVVCGWWVSKTCCTYCKINFYILHFTQGRGGDELSTDLSVALQCCLLGGKSGAGMNLIRAREVTICFLSFRLFALERAF